jgi:hypothetical protein
MSLHASSFTISVPRKQRYRSPIAVTRLTSGTLMAYRGAGNTAALDSQVSALTRSDTISPQQFHICRGIDDDFLQSMWCAHPRLQRVLQGMRRKASKRYAFHNPARILQTVWSAFLIRDQMLHELRRARGPCRRR